jgi:hypothetical protein
MLKFDEEVNDASIPNIYHLTKENKTLVRQAQPRGEFIYTLDARR